jgi:hypothetical protein
VAERERGSAARSRTSVRDLLDTGVGATHTTDFGVKL